MYGQVPRPKYPLVGPRIFVITTVAGQVVTKGEDPIAYRNEISKDLLRRDAGDREE